MANQTFGVEGAQAALVPDSAYGDVAATVIDGARHHCLAMLFIVDPDPNEDEALRVDGLLQRLAVAAWHGLDTRLLIGGSRGNGRILDGALVARARAQALGLPSRMVAAVEQRSNHAKILVADDRCLLGSHNWSPGSLGGQTQDSVLVRHAAIAAYFASRFEAHWDTARAEGFDVPA